MSITHAFASGPIDDIHPEERWRIVARAAEDDIRAPFRFGLTSTKNMAELRAHRYAYPSLQRIHARHQHAADFANMWFANNELPMPFLMDFFNLRALERLYSMDQHLRAAGCAPGNFIHTNRFIRECVFDSREMGQPHYVAILRQGAFRYHDLPALSFTDVPCLRKLGHHLKREFNARGLTEEERAGKPWRARETEEMRDAQRDAAEQLRLGYEETDPPDPNANWHRAVSVVPFVAGMEVLVRPLNFGPMFVLYFMARGDGEYALQNVAALDGPPEHLVPGFEVPPPRFAFGGGALTEMERLGQVLDYILENMDYTAKVHDALRANIRMVTLQVEETRTPGDVCALAHLFTALLFMEEINVPVLYVPRFGTGEPIPRLRVT
jgi:hypothetical protein